MEIREVDIKQLKFAEYNPREITDKAFEDLKNSLREFGFVEPAVVNKDNTIIGGHMRVRAAEAVGFTKVPAYYVDLPEDKARILNLALNRITGRWDVEKLGRLITDLTLKEVDMTLTGFDDWELQYYNQGPSKNTDVDNTNEEISDETLQNGLDIECPRCHFRFKKG